MYVYLQNEGIDKLAKGSTESESPRASTSSSDLDHLSKAKLAAQGNDPFNVSNDAVLKETEMTHKGVEYEPIAKQL